MPIDPPRGCVRCGGLQAAAAATAEAEVAEQRKHHQYDDDDPDQIHRLTLLSTAILARGGPERKDAELMACTEVVLCG